jgi:leader peptidase (prepilin peptidase)/N-methyltransferase
VSLLPGSPVRPLEAALAAGGGWLAFALVALAWEKLRHIPALGQGDWKMAAMLGAFLGWERLLLVVLLASASGALVGLVGLLSGRGGLRSRLPLGTFLGGAGILVVFFGEALLHEYRLLSFSLADALFGWLGGRAGG